MDWATDDNRAEWAVDATAAVVFAAAVAFVTLELALAAVSTAAAAATLAFLLVHSTLRKLPPEERSFALPPFIPQPVDLAPDAGGDTAGQLQLTIEQVVLPGDSGDGMLLHDKLGPVQSAARVVRLFNSRQAAGARELVTSDRAVGASHSDSALPDAAQALSDALAELRRSLR